MFIDIQLFAHKKGGGSTKNGRDSNAQRLGVKRADSSYWLVIFSYVNAERKFTPATTSDAAATTRCSRLWTAKSSSRIKTIVNR